MEVLLAQNPSPLQKFQHYKIVILKLILSPLEFPLTFLGMDISGTVSYTFIIIIIIFKNNHVPVFPNSP